VVAAWNSVCDFEEAGGRVEYRRVGLFVNMDSLRERVRWAFRSVHTVLLLFFSLPVVV
jgi:hypothetical protein